MVGRVTILEFIGIGDLHFDGSLRKYLPDLNKTICNEVFKTVKYGMEKGVRNYFFYGDIAHRPELSTNALQQIIQLYRRLDVLSEDDTKFYVISGNHDVLNADNNSLSVLKSILESGKLRGKWTLITEPTQLRVDDVPVHFMPWPCSDSRADCLNIAHLEVVGSKMDSGKASTTKVTFGKHLVASGHLHCKQVVGNTHFSGTLYQTNFGESMPKGFHHGRVKANLSASIDFVQRKPSIRLHNILIETLDDLEKVPQEDGDLSMLYVQSGADSSLSRLIGGLSGIADVKTVKSSKEMKALIQEEVTLTEEALSFNHSELLTSWLTSIKADKEDTDLALEEFNRLILNEQE